MFLLHGRGIAEILFDFVGCLFLARSAIAGDWAWLRTPWVMVAAAWWLWLVACSLQGGFGQAALVVRYLVFVAALDHWVLRRVWRRVWLARLAAWAAFYIAFQSMLQFATGRDIQGYRRYADGELTGPFEHPRAAAPLSRLLFPALLPRIAQAGWIGGLAWALGGTLVMVLIGQRMPLVLTGLGFVVTALLLPRLRPVVLAACLAGGLAVAASAVVSPPTFTRLVTKFSTQLEMFPETHYGLIAARATNIVEQHPVFGTGFDGFRSHCEDARYFGGWHGGDGGGAGICVQHPHNHYLQAADESGWPGLALFSALMLAWMLRLGRGLWRDPAPLRVGLFVAALIQVWPIASASAFTSMPLSGWFFLLLGLGLAETRAYLATAANGLYGGANRPSSACPTPSSPSPSSPAILAPARPPC